MLVAASAFRDRLFYITFAFFIARDARAEPEADIGGNLLCTTNKAYKAPLSVCTSDLSEKNEALYMIYATRTAKGSNPDKTPAPRILMFS